MGSYRRLKLVFDIFRNGSSKLLSKTPIQSSSSSLFNNPCKFSGSLSIFSKNGYLINLLKQNKSSLVSGVSKRYYYADRNQINNFKRRDYRRWFQNTRNALIFGLVGSGVAITSYFGSIGVVPYTKTKKFRIMFKDIDELFESDSKEISEGFEWKILPDEHPDSVRVRLIGNNIIASLGSLRNSRGDSTSKIGTYWRKWKELVDDKWAKPTNQHLDGLNWKVFVVDSPEVDAAYLPGGHIFIFTGLLSVFQKDAEIAAVIGHEVGHALALHCHVKILYALWNKIIQIVLFLLLMPPTVKSTIAVGVYAMYPLLLKPLLSQKRELEADYVGMMLMASAGYEPRWAPKVHKMFGEMLEEEEGGSIVSDIMSTHPSAKKRVKLLTESMDEALSLYRRTPSWVLETEKNRKREKITSLVHRLFGLELADEH